MSAHERRVAIEVARAAGDLLRGELRAPRHITYKGSSTNLVTEMDARAEALIVDRLLGAFPDDAVLAEERGAQPGRSGRRWIIDPVDGTTNYAHGLPAYAVSIALEVGGRVDLGVVYDPSHDELYVAERGRGAFCNDKRLTVSRTQTLDTSLLTTGFPYDIRVNPDNNLKEYAVFATRSRAVRRFGSAVLDLAWVACGRYDGFWEMKLKPWDLAPGILLVREAGGRVSDFDGGDTMLESGSICAANRPLHPQLMDVLAEVRASGG
jgi:myo-inositol-1(or 4)-monophosphatase